MPQPQGAQVICFQELFYGPYFGITEDKKYYGYAEPADGPIVQRFAALAEGARHRHGAPDLRGGQHRRLLQHRRRGRRRRHDPRQVPQAPHPAPRPVLGEVLLPPRQPRLPGVRHRGRQDRRLHLLRPALPRGLARARPERRADRVQPERHQARPLEPAVGDRAAGAPPSPTATSCCSRTGSAARTTSTATWPSTSTARARSIDPRGNFVGERGSGDRRGDRSSATSTWTWCSRCATTGSSTATAGRTRTPRSRSRRGASDHDHHPHHRRHRRQRDRPRRRPTCSSTARRSSPCSQPGLDAARHRPRGIRRHASSTRPASTSSPAASTRTPTWSCRSAAPRPSTPSRPAPAPRPGAARRSIIDFAVQTLRRSASRTASPPGTRRPRATARSTTASTRSSATSTTTRSQAMRGPARRGHHELQAVHGLPGRLLLRRRADPAGDAGRARHRAAHDDARRERPGHRRARRAARRRRARPTRTTTASPAPGRWRRRPRTARSCSPNLTGAPLYVVHVSAKQAVEQLAAARDKGQNVFGETCPQYLYLSLEEQLGAIERGVGRASRAPSGCARRRCARGRRATRTHMWQALRTNDLQMVSTDHCPFCMKDQKELGLGDFREIPNGIGSIEHRMDLMYQGVVTGEITLERWVELTSTTPGAHVRALRHEGRHPARRRRRHRRLRPERAHLDRARQDPPHEHGLLRVGGLRDRRPRRHRALAAARSSSTTTSTSAPRATAGSSSAACAST